jgi:hypothetical protein
MTPNLVREHPELVVAAVAGVERLESRDHHAPVKFDPREPLVAIDDT